MIAQLYLEKNGQQKCSVYVDVVTGLKREENCYMLLKTTQHVITSGSVATLVRVSVLIFFSVFSVESFSKLKHIK